ncbi:MAG: hypothetical protein DWQ02_24120 [Bacteroidetes bacterium]|nr:MAG: hypothetical protein DWQ02_24120 [Bacteroidota bacterium]
MLVESMTEIEFEGNAKARKQGEKVTRKKGLRIKRTIKNSTIPFLHYYLVSLPPYSPVPFPQRDRHH